MNIFHTSIDPVESANNLDDLRVNKMIIESAALLANAIAFHGGPESALPISKTSGKPFKTKAWQNHPSCLWVKKSRSNYNWLVSHLIALIQQMHLRKSTIHSMINNVQIIQDGAKYIPEGPLTAFENCTPYKSISDPIEAYRLCMVYKWEHDGKVPKWSIVNKPSWYSPEYIEQARTAKCEFVWTGLRQPRSKR
jgi:hypothetical protein